MDNNIIIRENDIELAQNICNAITDDNVRNRAVANIVASVIASRFFEAEQYDVDIESGLHNIGKILEDIDISDIYINGSYVDVRVYFSEDELCVPKKHFNDGLTPSLYMFVKLESDLSQGYVAGFISPESINKNNCDDDFYFINENELNSFYNLESELSKPIDTFEYSDGKLYELLDENLNSDEKIQLYKELIVSKTARTLLLKVAKAHAIFNSISISEVASEPISDSVNDVIQDESSENLENDIDNLFEEEENDIDENSLFNSLEYTTEVTPSDSEIIEKAGYTEDNDTETGASIDNSENQEQINNLFTGEQEGIPVAKKKRSTGLKVLLLLSLIIAGGGYLLYSNNMNNQNEDNLLPQGLPTDIGNEEVMPSPVQQSKTEDAMPNETVNIQNTTNNKEEAASVAIPAIEQHLDASVLVSNLKVDWEVPAGYASNTSAKRYLIKLGKIIQLNLKSELLLLSRPPIANKISVELKYNSNTGKFEIVGIQESSGEKTVDDTILQTIQSALSMSISSNIESFGKLQGNPVLIIHL